MGKTKLNVSLVRKAAMKEIRDNGFSPRAKAYLEFLHDWYKKETEDDYPSK